MTPNLPSDFALTPPPGPVTVPEYDIALIDGSYLIHRILYASASKGEPPFSAMMNSMGEPTGAIFGCLKTIRSIINLNNFVTRDAVVVWDGRPRGLSPRRVRLYPGYKIHEPSEDPKEAEENSLHRNLLEHQRPHLIRILELLGVPSIDIPFREGDDILACTTKFITGGDGCGHLRVVIVSDDRDFYQLVTPNVHVWRAGLLNPVLLTDHNFEKEIKVATPLQYLLKAAIVGDGSDAIQGIKNVGDTTAERVAQNSKIDQFIRFTTIKESVDKLLVSDTRNRKRYLTLMDNLGIVARNLELMDLRLEITNEAENAIILRELSRPRGVNEQLVRQEFDRLEFKSYLQDFSGWIQPFKKLQFVAKRSVAV